MRPFFMLSCSSKRFIYYLTAILKIVPLILKILTVAVILAAPLASIAQNRDEVSLPDSTNIVVRRLNFKGNDDVANNVLENLVRTHTNTTLFGIPGFTPFYGIYRLTGGAFGEDPVYLDYQTVAEDVERIDRYYESIGYFYTKIDTNIVITKKKARVTFLIDEGEQSFITSVAYSGLPDSAFTNKEAKIDFFKESELTEKQINDTTYQVNVPYNVQQLVDERERIIAYLKNEGYAAITSDSVSALIMPDKQNKYNLHVLLYVQPGHIYRFGNLYIRLAGPAVDTLITYQQQKAVQGNPFTTNGATIYLKKQKAAQTDWDLLTGQLLFQPGDTYSYERYISTINEFQNLTMMTIRQFGYTQTGTPPDFAGDTIPVYIFLQTLPKHSLSFNVFGMHRYGFGSGAGVTYTNNNLFGGAENLQIGVNGSFEYVTESTLRDAQVDSLTDGQNGTFFNRFEVRADYLLPKLTFPFVSLNDNLFFANSRTRYSISYSESDQLLFDINFNAGFNLRYEVRHNERFTSFFDLLDIHVLDTHPTDAFRQVIKDAFDDVIEERILNDYRPQISSVLRYTFRSENTDLIQRNYGYLTEYSISLGGNLPFLVDRFIITPGTVEGNLPSPVEISTNSLAYSRYVKLTADYRRYIPLSTNTVFAYRLFGGYAIPYGQSNNIPINERFYAGGSNDIRGWAYYSLGPGGIQLDNVAVNGGEVKLLGKVELRQVFLSNFLASNWIFALFADAGNVWYGPGNDILNNGYPDNLGGMTDLKKTLEKGQFHFDTFYEQIAVGSGVGLRLDFTYLIVRFDFAIRVHDPQQNWFPDFEKADEDGWLYFSFGIGHSF